MTRSIDGVREIRVGKLQKLTKWWWQRLILCSRHLYASNCYSVPSGKICFIFRYGRSKKCFELKMNSLHAYRHIFLRNRPEFGFTVLNKVEALSSFREKNATFLQFLAYSLNCWQIDNTLFGTNIPKLYHTTHPNVSKPLYWHFDHKIGFLGNIV